MRFLPGTPSHRWGRGIVVVCAAVWLVSFAALLMVAPGGTPVSADPGAEPIPYWVTVSPVVLGIALTLLVPPRSARRPVLIGRHTSFAITTAGLLALAVVFPVAAAVVPLRGESYVLGKLALLMIVPAVLVMTFRDAVRIQWRKDRSRWWAPAIVVVVWVLHSQVAPWNPVFDPAGHDLTLLVTAATATAITAGVGEELFYRLWLQSRLEAGMGPWPGICVASLAFALMHLGSHGTGAPLVDIARVVVVQGSFGLFVGIMWWRYRNLVAIILVHVIVNGWAIAVALLLR